MTEVNEVEFREAISANEVVVVQFSAPWCGPCKVLSANMPPVVAEFEGKATFIKVNVDNEAVLSAEHAIRGIPSVYIYENGVRGAKIMPGGDPTKVKEALEKVLAGAEDDF